MVNKKLMMSATLGTAVATLMMGTDEAQAQTYHVQSGDSLWAIANQFDTSVPALKSINELTGNIIFPNQVIQTSSSSASEPEDTESEAKPDTDHSQPATYTVKQGDTLSGIASDHQISLSDLMEWNDLDTTLIFPGNEFVVEQQTASDQQPEKPEKSDDASDSSNEQSNNESSGSGHYVVQSGDTLSAVAGKHNVSVNDLKNWNNLKSDLIVIGQKLKLDSKADDSTSDDTTVEDTPPSNIDYNINNLIQTATGLEGTPYVWAGSTPAGFDCSGFIFHTYKSAGKDLARLSTEGYYNRSYDIRKPKKGDLVFFKNTYKSGISHMGIYLGDDEFIHAGSNGVEISNVNYDYWQDHFDGYKRFY